jgi:iron complex transport system ATP-binding protein
MTGLQCIDLSARLGDVVILQNLNLALPRARWTSIVGPNGAGKSTLLKVLAGLLPHTGTVMLEGRPLSQWPNKTRAQRLAWLGQNETSADDLTVWDLAMLGRLPHQAWLSSPLSLIHI